MHLYIVDVNNVCACVRTLHQCILLEINKLHCYQKFICSTTLHIVLSICVFVHQSANFRLIFIRAILIYINESNFQDRLGRTNRDVIFIDGLNKCLGTYY
jgi:hypothetical protein